MGQIPQSLWDRNSCAASLHVRTAQCEWQNTSKSALGLVYNQNVFDLTMVNDALI